MTTTRMRITLERQVELESLIKDRGKWVAFRIRIGFLHRLYRQGTLSKEEYLYQHSRSTLSYAGVAI
jgi:hypothetical protein